jgi:hypothetical protein
METSILHLRLEVASLAAVEAIIVAILAEADAEFSLAEAAVALALAFVFVLVALHTNKRISHAETLPRFFVL